jgi:ElaB/YqjD/DUF883 family membrane-anchored ribosome-binding protein
MTMNTEEYTSTETGGDRIKEAAGGVASEAGRAAETRASETMTKLGDTLEQVAQAVRDAGSGMREQQPQVANVADTAASQVEKASQYLRQHDAREALEAAQDFARRQPLVVAGGGLALGLVVGRLLKTAGSAGGTSSRGFSGGYGAYGSGYDRYSGESYAGGTYGGSSFGGSTVAGSTGTDYASGGTGFDTAGTGYGTGGLSDAAGTSTIASGQAIDDGGALDTGQGVTPDGAFDRDTVGLADRSVDEER